MRIALTGGIGSGKSAAAHILRQWGYPVVDADALARSVVHEDSVAAQICSVFGSDAFLPSGELNRAWLRSQIFARPDLKQKLESIMHPAIEHRFQCICAQLEALFPKIWIFYEIPLLFELGRESDFDSNILITASKDVRLHRLITYRNLSLEDAQNIMAQQMPEEEKRKKAQWILENNGNLEELEHQLFLILRQIRRASVS